MRYGGRECAVRLVLEDGTTFDGSSFGSEACVGGEVVFNTAMAGYIETLTDPSYRGQILVCTYPLIGNYGVPGPCVAGQMSAPYESDKIQIQGLVVQKYMDNYSHGDAQRSLRQWLCDEGVPAITGIDTRVLTQKLREAGTMQGWLMPEDISPDRARDSALRVDMEEEVFRLVAPSEVIRYEGGKLRVLLVDVGAKHNIIRSLLQRSASVVRVPWYFPLRDYVDECDAILIGNGPGDPKDLQPLVQQVRELLDSFRGPIMGVCMGNQILALAAGGDTYKLPYGHRGIYQPVQDLMTRRCFITSQNHGYAVDEQSLSGDWEPWFVNVNDGTNEGIRSRTRPFMSVQFHPEASPGPSDTGYLFDDFLALASRM